MSAVLATADDQISSSLTGPGSTQVSSFTPTMVSADEQKLEDARFAHRFIETMAGRASSLLASDVYRETRAEALERAVHERGLTPDEYQGLKILLTGHAWLSVSKAKVPYEQQLIEKSLDDNLIDRIAGKRIAITSKGPGPNGTADSKEGLLVAAFLRQGREVVRYTAVDINRTYAANSSSFMGNKHNIPAIGIHGDFVGGKLAPLPNTPMDSDVVEIVTVFGNTPFNAARHIQDGKPISYEDGAENFFGRMNKQHGHGHYLVLTVDTDQNPKSQLKNYAVTPEHEQLILSPLAMARFHGIITEPYPIFSHWNMKVSYDQSTDSVIMSVAPKIDHTMKTIGGDFHFSAGTDQRCIMASHKWKLNQHMKVLSNAGYEIVDTFDQEHNPHKLILARAVRDPRREPY